MKWKVTAAPAVEPITLDQAKDNMKVTNNAEDMLIESLIVSARDYCEQELDLAIIDQEITLRLDGFPNNKRIDLPRSNLLSVESIAYTDSSGQQQTFSDYEADTFAVPGLILLGSSGANAGAVTIVYRAGFAPYTGGAPQVPGVIRQAMLMLVAHWFENRSAVTVGVTSSPVAFAVEACLMKYRRLGI